jgi:FlaA1/EpsC-like NDP-sugar epimerase
MTKRLFILGRWLALLPPRAKLAVLLAVDGLFLPLCAALSMALAAEGWTTALALGVWPYLLVGLLTQAFVFSTGLYRSVVRFLDQRVVGWTAAGLALAVLGIEILLLLAPLDEPVRKSAPVIYWFVAFTYLMSSRFLARSLLLKSTKRPGRQRPRTLIYGAGQAGVQIARAMGFGSEYLAVCFIDDAKRLQGRTVAGLPVYAPAALATALARHDVEQIVIAIPSASVSQRRAVIGSVESAGLPVKVLPGLDRLFNGRAHVGDIRNIDVSDLLGRDPVPPDHKLFARNLKHKSVMVTGAGGSIGNELCRQILTQQPQRLVLFDHSEFGLYTIEQELRPLAGDTEIVGVLGSVLDEALLTATMRRHAVQTAYPAAAFKHVPIVEANIRQGVVNNVFGTLAVARAARRARLETCVLVSTDKAVRPTNVMGASKRIAELVFQAAAERCAQEARAGGTELSRTVFAMVRFGNVLGSSGSVVPLFTRQIRAGGPVTITHPDVIRYFMLIPEAAQLVIQAGAMARGGEVFVLDMGEPVRIADLARSMIQLFGLSERTPEHPDGDIALAYVGMRPGEKLYEELLIGNNPVPSGHPRILCAMERLIEPATLDQRLQELRAACDSGEDDQVLAQVRRLVPEYTSPELLNPPAAQPPAFLATV